MNIHIITIGDEILIGQITDTNSAWMAKQLNLQGARVTAIHSIGDNKDAIDNTLEKALEHADAVLITGGLGPTKDDITKKVLADFFDMKMAFSQEVYDRLIRMYKRMERQPPARLKAFCYFPESAKLLYNKRGTAPGMWFESGKKVVISMPGVPHEMKYLMSHEVLPGLKQKFGGQPFAHRNIHTVGEGESLLAARISDFENHLPENIKLAYLPHLGAVSLRLTGSGDDEKVLHKLLDQKVKAIQKLIPEFIFGYENDTLQAVTGRLLTEKKASVCTAESCTGGLIAHQITSIPGASEYFKGSIVAYSNEVKMQLLGVKEATLTAHGAVSKETVEEMALGAKKLLETDYAISVSGIAGPSGGTPEKPVGTVWIGIAGPESVYSKKLQLSKDRLLNIQYAAIRALDMLWQGIKD